NVQNALTGKIAGVKVTQGTSEPGNFGDADTPNSLVFSIRGLGKPLIVIDGVPRDNMVRLDPNDIESVSVLKDASAAVYGTRAANGVVLITTKKGQQNEKFHFDYNGYVGGQKFLFKGEFIDALGYMELRNEQYANNGRAMPYTKEQFEAYRNGTKQSTDWWNPYISSFPLETMHSLSATGGSDKVDYYVNFGYFNQEGMWKVKSSDYKRYNLRSNITARLAKGLKAEVLLNLMQDKRLRQPEGTWRIFRAVLEQNPLLPRFVNNDPAYPINGSIDYRLDMDKDGYWRFIESLVQSNVALEWEIPGVKGLKVRGMYSLDYTSDDTKNFRKGYTTYNENKVPGGSTYRRIERYYDNYQNTLMQLSLSYEKKINSHNIAAALFYEESDREADNFQANRTDLLIDVLDQLPAGDPSTQASTLDLNHLYHYANKGFIGKFTYDFASKYLFDFSFRYDGSSNFAPGRQWGFFPSVSAGWRISEESFLKDKINALNNLKLRGSYGVLGDDGEAAYQFYSGYTYPAANNWGDLGGFELNGSYITAIAPRGIVNQQLTWITATSVDIGLDVDLWNGLLSSSIDLFRRDRSGLLGTRTEALPGEVGANMPQENLNSDMMLGYEISLTHKNKIGSDFLYSLGANFSFNRSKAKHIEVAQYGNSYRNWRSNMNDRWKVFGAKPGDNNNAADNFYWGVGYLGQYQSFGDIYNGPVTDSKGNSTLLPGDLIYEDWNGDGVIDDLDRHPLYIKTQQRPLITFGFNIGADYKGFDLNLLFSGVGMSRIRHDSGRSYYEAAFQSADNAFSYFMDRWHRADQWDSSPYQEWIPGRFPSNYTDNGRSYIRDYNSDFWIENGSYLRLKSIELGYTLPSAISRKAGIDKARIFLNSYNAWTWTKVTIADPERINANENVDYPVNQTFNLGVNLSF
ncbi:MAG: SusC/RagA family TonB-linked outer membrane protein, partial [Dysgonamonadaceae bacterium]|nr:SusC/RagA family TonB-linked outer membrane protein [Dysgonamonadaceae bacterium]